MYMLMFCGIKNSFQTCEIEFYIYIKVVTLIGNCFSILRFMTCIMICRSSWMLVTRYQLQCQGQWYHFIGRVTTLTNCFASGEPHQMSFVQQPIVENRWSIAPKVNVLFVRGLFCVSYKQVLRCLLLLSDNALYFYQDFTYHWAVFTKNCVYYKLTIHYRVKDINHCRWSGGFKLSQTNTFYINMRYSYVRSTHTHT